MEILVGTNNLHKYKEYKEIFNAYAPEIKILSSADFKITENSEEDSNSLLDNAIKKAKFFGDKSGIITLADDTGLFVDALNGEPGVNTKRWHAGTDHDRCLKLLERLKNIPKEKLTARYIGAFAIYNPSNKNLWTFQEKVEGVISDKFGKEGGFGYDRIFMVPSMDKYYSEFSTKELIEMGDRGKAVKELIFNTNFLK